MFEQYRKNPRPVDYAEGDTRLMHRDAVISSADYLAQHFHEVPIMLIPLIQGRLDGLSAHQGAGAWGSILPAVWSFMLALRERGLGSAWTTLHLAYENEVAELLGIPHDRYTQAGPVPIAHTIGPHLQPPARLPLH